jgi:hypothetical protein
VILSGGSSASNGGIGGEATASAGMASSGGSLDASGGTTGTGSGGGSASGGSGGQSGGSAGTGGVVGGSASGGGGSKSSKGGSAVAGASGSTGGAAGYGGTAGTGGTVNVCNGCQSLEECSMGRMCVAQSVQVPPSPNPFLIDATEVTRGQYAAWLATNPDPNTTWPNVAWMPPMCSWNVSFTPDATCMANPSVCQGTGCANHPQVCINMCDALSYCYALGKQLCSGSQWLGVCTSNGVNQHTYGNSFGPGKCHDFSDPNSSTTVPVGSMPECQPSVSGLTGVFDLEGNVSEWVDNCTGSAGATDMCETLGSTYGVGAAAQDCNTSYPRQRASVFFKLGFRCCMGLVH